MFFMRFLRIIDGGGLYIKIYFVLKSADYKRGRIMHEGGLQTRNQGRILQILIGIFHYLNSKALKQVRSVCRLWNAVASKEINSKFQFKIYIKNFSDPCFAHQLNRLRRNNYVRQHFQASLLDTTWFSQVPKNYSKSVQKFLLLRNILLVIIGNTLLLFFQYSSLPVLWGAAILLGIDFSTVFPSFYGFIESH